MATLQRVRGSSLVPNINPALNILEFGRQERKATRAAEAQSQAIGQGVEQVIAGSPQEQEAALLRLSAINPQVAAQMRQILERGDAQEIQLAASETERGAREAILIQSAPDFVSKRQAITQAAQEALGRGEDISRFVKLANLPEAELDNELQRRVIQATDIGTLTKGALGGGQAGSFSKSPGVIVQQPDGSFAQSIPVLNQQTGQIEQQIVPIEGQPVSRIGETGQQLTQRQIEQAGGVAEATQAAEIAAAPERVSTTKKAQRQQADIDKAFIAADSISTFNRGIELLDSVETGGFDAAALRAKQIFGVESANEAELSNSLGKAVLAQLRDTFGAAFTAQEGESLKQIEANFGKSTEGNKRLLKRAKRLAQRVIDRGVRAARKIGDEDTALQIEEAAAFQLTDEQPDGTPTGQTTPEGFPIFQRADGSTFAVSP